MSEDELLLVAKLRALEPTQDGRVMRGLLDLLMAERRRRVEPGCRPPCGCHAGGGLARLHSPTCPARLTYEEHVAASVHEWRRATALADSLARMRDAVAAEVAVHPGMHDRVAAAYKKADATLEEHRSSAFPGDDGLPF